MVDAVRAAAVLCMMQWHCADAWIGGHLRIEGPFNVTRIIGGLAAPLFLFLAGISSGLVFDPSRLWPGVRRGAGILVGGYVFKLFAWAVDYGALVEPCNWAAIATDGITLLLTWRMVSEKTPSKHRLPLAALVIASIVVTAFALTGATRTPSLIVRLDVLQGIGACVIVVNFLLFMVHGWRSAPWLFALLAVIVALTTPSWIGVDLSLVPTRLADYIARTTLEPGMSGARFPFFPWLAYTLLGAGIGIAVRARPRRDAWDVPFSRNGYLALGMAILIALCVFEPMPSAQWILVRSEQTRNLLRLAWNVSAAFGLAGFSSIVLPRLPAVQRTILSLGRHSLVIYVVHLEIAYGLATSPIRETLGFGGWAIGLALVLTSMIGLAFWLDARDARARPKTPDAVKTLQASPYER